MEQRTETAAELIAMWVVRQRQQTAVEMDQLAGVNCMERLLASNAASSSINM